MESTEDDLEFYLSAGLTFPSSKMISQFLQALNPWEHQHTCEPKLGLCQGDFVWQNAAGPAQA